MSARYFILDTLLSHYPRVVVYAFNLRSCNLKSKNMKLLLLDDRCHDVRLTKGCQQEWVSCYSC